MYPVRMGRYQIALGITAKAQVSISNSTDLDSLVTHPTTLLPSGVRNWNDPFPSPKFVVYPRSSTKTASIIRVGSMFSCCFAYSSILARIAPSESCDSNAKRNHGGHL